MGKGHKDKVAVITGGANGIGQAFAKRLAEDGVHVAVADLADGRGDRQARRSRRAAGARGRLRRVEGGLGRGDGQTGAGQIRPRRYRGELRRHFSAAGFCHHDASPTGARCSSINLDGTFLVTAAFVPGMRARKWGRVVSMASSTFGSVTTGFAHYVASKGGIIGFTRGLAGDVAADGITVNAIAPGLTRSPGTLVRQAAPGLCHHGRGIRRGRRACRRSSAWRCRTIWSARCRFSPATTPPS